jgi:hyperosmotically inducible periplasmic protein
MSQLSRKISRVAYAAALAGALAFALAPPAGAVETPDPWVTTKVKLSLLSSDGVDGLDVNVDTIDGRVTLHGTASTTGERARAEELTKQIDGVREVRNLIQVVPAKVEDAVAAVDETIQERVTAALKAEPGLGDSSIAVQSVHQGAVLLGGTATSLTAHLLAIEIAHDVDGVRRVASEITSPDKLADAEIWRDSDKAAAPAYSLTASTGARAAVSNAWLTSAAKVRLLASDVSAFDVNVDTRGGVVTLFGTVGSDAEKRLAESEVKKVDGVSSVRNELQVVAATRQEAVERKDEAIQEGVSKRLAARDELADSKIDVQVENGVVRLTGQVESQSDRLSALTTARTSDGVRSVIGDLRVGRN